MMDMSRPESCRLDLHPVFINHLLLPTLHFMKRKLLYTIHTEKTTTGNLYTSSMTGKHLHKILGTGELVLFIYVCILSLAHVITALNPCFVLAYNPTLLHCFSNQIISALIIRHPKAHCALSHTLLN